MKEELQKWVVNIINTKESGSHTPRVIEEHDLQFFFFFFLMVLPVLLKVHVYFKFLIKQY